MSSTTTTGRAVPGRCPVSGRPYDRWRDAEGVHIADGCRVEQIAVSKEHGALPSRLSKHGEVVGRGTHRVTVRFDTETKPAGVRPHLLRVTNPPAPSGGGRQVGSPAAGPAPSRRR